MDIFLCPYEQSYRDPGVIPSHTRPRLIKEFTYTYILVSLQGLKRSVTDCEDETKLWCTCGVQTARDRYPYCDRGNWTWPCLGPMS